jgi:hypothetical protein
MLIQAEKNLALGLFDMGNDVTDANQLFSFFVRNFDTELFLDSHHQLDSVEGIGTEIFDHLGLGLHLISADAELFHDDFCNFFCDVFCHDLMDVDSELSGMSAIGNS